MTHSDITVLPDDDEIELRIHRPGAGGGVLLPNKIILRPGDMLVLGGRQNTMSEVKLVVFIADPPKRHD